MESFISRLNSQVSSVCRISWKVQVWDSGETIMIYVSCELCCVYICEIACSPPRVPRVRKTATANSTDA